METFGIIFGVAMLAGIFAYQAQIAASLKRIEDRLLKPDDD